MLTEILLVLRLLYEFTIAFFSIRGQPFHCLASMLHSKVPRRCCFYRGVIHVYDVILNKLFSLSTEFICIKTPALAIVQQTALLCQNDTCVQYRRYVSKKQYQCQKFFQDQIFLHMF